MLVSCYHSLSVEFMLPLKQESPHPCTSLSMAWKGNFFDEVKIENHVVPYEYWQDNPLLFL